MSIDPAPSKPEPPRREPAFRLADYQDLPVADLQERAGAASPGLDRGELVLRAVRREHGRRAVGSAAGILDVRPEGFGFLRHLHNRGVPGGDDVYLSRSQVHRLALPPGSRVEGVVRLPRTGERYLAMIRVQVVDGRGLASHYQDRNRSTATTPVLPRRRLVLAPSGGDSALRALDLLAPLAHGHRVLVRGPEAAALPGEIRSALLRHHEGLRVVQLLVDRPAERLAAPLPEGAADPRVETFASDAGEPAERHVELMRLAAARARRLVEAGGDVVLWIDCLCRLLRACAATTAFGGERRVLLGPRRLLGLARQTGEGPALTVFARLCPEPDLEPEAHADGARLAAELQGLFDAEIALDPDSLEPDPRRCATRPESDPRSAPLRRAAGCLRQRLAGMPAAAARGLLHQILDDTRGGDTGGGDTGGGDTLLARAGRS